MNKSDLIERMADQAGISKTAAGAALDAATEAIKGTLRKGGSVTLVGFGDAKNDPQRAALLSKLRAMAVRRELVRSGVVLRDIRGFGAQMPVAANTADEGRIKNRRVEVWVY